MFSAHGQPRFFGWKVMGPRFYDSPPGENCHEKLLFGAKVIAMTSTCPPLSPCPSLPG